MSGSEARKSSDEALRERAFALMHEADATPDVQRKAELLREALSCLKRVKPKTFSST